MVKEMTMSVLMHVAMSIPTCGVSFPHVRTVSQLCTQQQGLWEQSNPLA